MQKANESQVDFNKILSGVTNVPKQVDFFDPLSNQEASLKQQQQEIHQSMSAY